MQTTGASESSFKEPPKAERAGRAEDARPHSLKTGLSRLASWNSGPYGAVVLGVIALALLPLAIDTNRRADAQKRVAAARVQLDLFRHRISLHFDIHESYPESLSAIASVDGASEYVFTDFKRMKADRLREHRRLDGQGGYFYDPNTGQVRVNLTLPVRVYVPDYEGPRADEIPSTW